VRSVEADNSGLSIYGLNGLSEGDEHPAFMALVLRYLRANEGKTRDICVRMRGDALRPVYSDATQLNSTSS